MKRILIFTFSILILSFNSSCGGGNPKGGSDTTRDTSQPVTGLNIGNIAPELEYSSPSGELIKLSSLRGQVVLIDFWASWCGPCRNENPNIVATWEKYKDAEFRNGKGFNIYSISLDPNRESWIKGIKEDKLNWRTHVSDLKYWQSVPAALYQVNSIPSNFLIDGEGIIIARNLRGPALAAELDKYIK